MRLLIVVLFEGQLSDILSAGEYRRFKPTPFLNKRQSDRTGRCYCRNIHINNRRFTISQVEQQIESLPSISGADYSAEITLEVEKGKG